MPANGTRELIKEKFNPFTKMPWIDFNKGDAEVSISRDLIRINVLFLGLGTIKCR